MHKLIKSSTVFVLVISIILLLSGCGAGQQSASNGSSTDQNNEASSQNSSKKAETQAKDVRQVLQYVETGNADVGFVYKTDALTSQKAKIAFEVDSTTYSPVEYPIGIIKGSKHIQEAEDFYAYLQSQESLNIMAKYGFTIPK
ncbi:molybdate ABC transporter substrate-binding protein [Paenibacillus polymyxa]|uniref:molybdate ABC transporter substrate-binding protein n=1 Tax=Paenibacillus polymyxa TaxID=1406 RepID=UPI0027A642A5|nr:molybdate ABC transporter substrate-binding protein [Paenibacillus polymyxa]